MPQTAGVPDEIGNLIARIGNLERDHGGRTYLRSLHPKLWVEIEESVVETPLFLLATSELLECMAKTRKEKEQALGELTEAVQEMRGAVFANYEGLKTKEIEELRHLLAGEGVTYTVAKKTILKLAFKQSGIGVDPKTIVGNFATIISKTDEGAPARLAARFGKDHEALKILGGILEGKLMEAASVLALSKLPGKQELLRRVVGTLQTPIAGFARVLIGNLRDIVTVLNAIKDQKAA